MESEAEAHSEEVAAEGGPEDEADATRCNLCLLTEQDLDPGQQPHDPKHVTFPTQRRFGPPICDNCEHFLRYQMQVRARSKVIDQMTQQQLDDTLEKLSWFYALRRTGAMEKVHGKALEQHMATGAAAADILATMRSRRRGLRATEADTEAVMMGFSDYVLRCGNPFILKHAVKMAFFGGKMQLCVEVPLRSVNIERGRFELAATVRGAWPDGQKMPASVEALMSLKIDELAVLKNVGALVEMYGKHMSLIQQAASGHQGSGGHERLLHSIARPQPRGNIANAASALPVNLATRLAATFQQSG